jgi:excisionase family DNA binding protein
MMLMDATLDRLASSVLENGPLLTLGGAAQVLGVSTQTVRRMVAAGEISAVQLGGHSGRPLRISASALNARLDGWETRGG